MNPPENRERTLVWDPDEFMFAEGTGTTNTLVCRRCGVLVYGHSEAQAAHRDEHATRDRRAKELDNLAVFIARTGGERAFVGLVVAHVALGAAFVLHLFRLGQLGLPW